MRTVLVILICSLAQAAQVAPPRGRAPKPKGDDAEQSAGEEKPESAPDAEAEKLPSLDQMELPPAARLLKGPAIDWIVLRTQKVIQAEPVYPRPNTLDKISAEIKNLSKLGLSRDEEKSKRIAMNYLEVTLLEGDDREFKIHIKHIKEIIHYEDLMLRRIDQLLDDQKTAEAFELLAALEERSSRWPGVDQRQDRLLFVEAAVKLKQNSLEEALVFLEELHGRTPRYEGLLTQLDVVGGKLLSAAAAQDDFRRARHFLERLRKRVPELLCVKTWTSELTKRASAELEQAVAAEQLGRLDVAVETVEEAARIWPQTAGLQESYYRLSNRFQRLHVGVVHGVRLAEGGGLAKGGRLAEDQLVRSAADLRERELGALPLFEPARIEGKVIRYQTQVFEEWEPTDLGRGIHFRLKTRRTAWESSVPIMAGPIVAAFAERMDPHSAGYDERFASLVSSVSFHSPIEFSVNFGRVPPLRPEALFTLPPYEGEQPRFRLHSETEQAVVYRRAVPEPSDNTTFHVAEIIEHRYATYEKSVQGLQRGEVALLPHVELWDVPRFKALKDCVVRPYALPVTHVLQFHPQHPALANRALRRALVFALDRQQILEEEFLEDKSLPRRYPEMGRLTSAPFPTTSYAYNRAVPPHKHDLRLAFAMLAAARKELGHDVPVLRLNCPDNATMLSAAKRLIHQWEQIGLKVTLTTGPVKSLGTIVSTEGESAGEPVWDIVYRALTMVEPLMDLWPCLTLDPHARIGALAHLPNWLRQELISLEQAGDWTGAQTILHELHRHLWAEVFLIPLWEVSDFLVVRNKVRDASSVPMFTYQGIERWRVQPWFPKDPP